MSRYLLALFISIITLKGEDLGTLLNKYQDKSDLSRIDKESKNGNIIIYTRKDLDAMQAYTLKDVIKNIRLFSLKTTPFGGVNIVKTPMAKESDIGLKLIIDEMEISSFAAGGGIMQYEKIGLSFVDHIEIYQAANAVLFEGQPAGIVIRLYSKDPSLENLTSLLATIDNRASLNTQITSAGEMGDYDYLATIDAGKYNHKHYHNSSNNSKLSKDLSRVQGYLKFGKDDDFLATFGIIAIKSDILKGFGEAIDDGEIKNLYINGSFTKFFEDNIKLVLDLSHEEAKLDNSDLNGFVVQASMPASDISSKNRAHVANATLDQEIYSGDHEIRYGIQLKYRDFKQQEMRLDGVEHNLVMGARRSHYAYLFAEDNYHISDAHSIIFGAKLAYSDNRYKKQLNHTLRVGYTGEIMSNLVLRAAVQRSYTPPTITQTTFSPLYKPNPRLKNAKNTTTKIELEKSFDATKLTFGVAKLTLKDGFAFSHADSSFINIHNSMSISQYYANIDHRFDTNNRIFAEFFNSYTDAAYRYSSKSGALVQLFNTIGSFDLYNELLYRSSYNDALGLNIADGYDYTAGIIYRYSKALEFKLKGENVFGKASKTAVGLQKIDPYDKRVLFSVEYTF